jgi:hypothetical protein
MIHRYLGPTHPLPIYPLAITHPDWITICIYLMMYDWVTCSILESIYAFNEHDEVLE